MSTGITENEQAILNDAQPLSVAIPSGLAQNSKQAKPAIFQFNLKDFMSNVMTFPGVAWRSDFQLDYIKEVMGQ